MPVIVKLPRAKSDLVEIWDYIADDSEARADAFIETIDQKFNALAGETWAVYVTNWRTAGAVFRLAGMLSFTALFRKASRLSVCCTARETWTPFFVRTIEIFEHGKKRHFGLGLQGKTAQFSL